MAPNLTTNTAPGSAGQNGAHTPGPWVDEMELPMATRQVSAFGKDGNRVLCIRIQSFNLDADTALVTAAPQMLEALEPEWAECLYQFLLREYAAAPDSGHAVSPDLRPHFEALCAFMARRTAAIAAATGEAV